uniref:Uncharacterized protein n=1 Tax=Tetradesmus obliquus TaxID=3088 RepID=A0A383W3Z7_TETOB|eukprot:jgi/Sobl393_1/3000/SZX71842.1
MDGLGAHSQLLHQSRASTSYPAISRRAGHPVLCFRSHATVNNRSTTCSSRGSSASCRVSSSRGAGDIPVVNDATVLPPPPTGSQYAWRRSWAGAGANSSGSAGNGGRGGGSQGRRTRDWGSGRPGSGLLYILMYRIRLLLLYGAWVTVLYGAVHAVCDLSAKVGRTALGLAGKASGWAAANGTGDAASSSSSSSGSEAASPAAGAAASSAAAGAEAAAGSSSQQLEAAAAAAAPPGDGGSDNGSRFASISSRLQERPTARVFNDLMACVIPLYLMLLGSVCFFASL